VSARRSSPTNRKVTTVIDISYSLHPADGGESRYEEVQAPAVPRIGELVAFDHDVSYQVVDVLWQHLPSGSSVTVTAHEKNWHEHYREVSTAWEAANG
jgi:hypothetical protein